MPTIPRLIWTLWLQGWEDAPEIVRACHQTLRTHNPDWEIRALTRNDVSQWLAEDTLLSMIAGKTLEPETSSDVIRIALLRRYGGVWADSTVYFLEPLDRWLHEKTVSGFFAFAWPAGRKLSSWFLAAEEGSYLIDAWYRRCLDYWKAHDTRDEYFWIHRIFADATETDERFRNIWDATPRLSSIRPHYLVPYEKNLPRPVTNIDRAMIKTVYAPLLKLSRHIDPSKCGESSMYAFLCRHAMTSEIALHQPSSTDSKQS
jgi:hypothetical protein